jgi:hypothetical protein
VSPQKTPTPDTELAPNNYTSDTEF